jgi:hypothetical protein
MKKLLKKYAVILILVSVITRLITAVILTLYPDLLVRELSSTETYTFGDIYITKALEYILNICIVMLIHKDMKKEGFMSIPILIMTFFSSFLGIVFFIFYMAYHKLTNKQIQTA